MIAFMLSLILLHGCLFMADEYLFHKKRGLARAEINNSLIDGALFLIPLVICIFFPYMELTKNIFLATAFLSCMSIAKNELFYKDLCVRERLIHSLLYVLHPAILYTFFVSWEYNYFHDYPNFWMVQLIYIFFGTKTLAYRIIYWNYIFHPDDLVKDSSESSLTYSSKYTEDKEK
ncbi:hypothetical protein [Bacteriovorax sp. DB6_IX]|uniref:hypothetical protein n=1 Tax=Bacteriovorax sp. DB6_IX TaxID=1353530 RepID=UPI00038A3E74|nr:hypothetical protein [Bacteriovorax sp. DB6_IX]EQC51574.1 hypothetical protein M901_1198 [Bacteriovorax sp. DB6_IX]